VWKTQKPVLVIGKNTMQQAPQTFFLYEISFSKSFKSNFRHFFFFCIRLLSWGGIQFFGFVQLNLDPNLLS